MDVSIYTTGYIFCLSIKKGLSSTSLEVALSCESYSVISEVVLGSKVSVLQAQICFVADSVADASNTLVGKAAVFSGDLDVVGACFNFVLCPASAYANVWSKAIAHAAPAAHVEIVVYVAHDGICFCCEL